MKLASPKEGLSYLNWLIEIARENLAKAFKCLNADDHIGMGCYHEIANYAMMRAKTISPFIMPYLDDDAKAEIQEARHLLTRDMEVLHENILSQIHY